MDTTHGIAWATGVFEGEGSIITRAKSSVILKMDMTDKDVIDRVHKIFGKGYVIQLPKRQEHWKDAWRWQVGRSEEAIEVLNLMLPYLGERRLLKAYEAIEYYENGLKIRQDTKKLHDAIIELWDQGGLTEQKIADRLGTTRANVNVVRRRNSSKVTVQVLEPWD